jgi:hypothetical protein
MLALKQSGKGYDMDDGNDCIPGGAYVDDMVLHTNTNKDLQYLFDECKSYFDFVGLNISYNDKEKDKIIYTNNTSRFDTLYFDEKDNNRNIIRKYVLYNSGKEFYKYLEIWINLELDWTKQISVTNFMFSKYISYLYKKCFNATQTVEILNLVVFPAITYRMNIIFFSPKQVAKWDTKAINLVVYKLRENRFIESNH